MSYDIDSIFEYLSWNEDVEKQELGITLAKKITNLSVLIMPIENKSIWENCAKVIASKSDEKIQLYFYELFEWLKDMNWPGAYIIYDRLLRVSKKNEILVNSFSYSISIAKMIKDHAWIMALDSFYNDRMKEFKSSDTII